jgi:hypothetical protein
MKRIPLGVAAALEFTRASGRGDGVVGSLTKGRVGPLRQSGPVLAEA